MWRKLVWDGIINVAGMVFFSPARLPKSKSNFGGTYIQPIRGGSGETRAGSKHVTPVPPAQAQSHFLTVHIHRRYFITRPPKRLTLGPQSFGSPKAQPFQVSASSSPITVFLITLSASTPHVSFKLKGGIGRVGAAILMQGLSRGMLNEESQSSLPLNSITRERVY
jgi:hypothetical protein